MILITGCNSLLGKALIKALLKQGEQVRGFDLYKEKDFPEKAEFFQGNLLDQTQLKIICQGIKTIFHLMEIKKPGKDNQKFIKKVNIEGTSNILVAAKNAEVKKFFFLSSFAVYGNLKDIPFRQDSPKKPISKYGKQKLKAEKICWKYITEDSLDITIFRPALIAGAGVDNQIILSMLYLALAMGEENKMYLAGKGDTRFQLLHPDDALQAFLAAYKSKNQKGKVYNLGSDQVLTQIEQVLKIKENSTFSIKYISPFKIKFLALASRLFKFSFFSKEHVYFLLNNMILDCQKAKKELKWTPQKNNIDIMLEIIEWYKKEKL